MILVRTQFSLNKDHQRPKWQSQKSWTLYFQTSRMFRSSSRCSIRFIRMSKWKVHPNYWKFPKSECPDIWIRLPRHKWPKSWSSKEDPVVPLERNLYGHPLAGLSWDMQFEKVLLEPGWEKVSNRECFFVHRERRLFLSVCGWHQIGWK